MTRWGMSDEVGVMFTDYRANAGSAGLNMRRVELADKSAGPRSLIMDVDGNLLPHGGDVADRQHSMFAMTTPDANPSTSTSMASLIDREVQRILHEGYEMARELLHEHSDQLTKLAGALMSQEQLDRKQFEALLG